MPSPVAHTLIGLTAANVVLKHKLYQSLLWLLFVVFAANAADLDFLAGWYFNDINRFHHGISHSIGMAFIFAVICTIIFTPVDSTIRAGICYGACYIFVTPGC